MHSCSALVPSFWPCALPISSAIAKLSWLSAPRRLTVAASDSKLRSACGSNSVHRIFASPGFCAAAWVAWNRSSLAASGARMSTSPALARIADEIGRAHVRTPVTNAHLVCRLLLEKQKKTKYTTTKHYTQKLLLHTYR